MANLLEQITTEYGEKIFVSEKNREKYGDLQALTGTEKALYELLESFGADNLQLAIEKNTSWDTIYNFSGQRINFISWLPIEKEHKILEIGAECGAVTSYLAAKAGHVDAVEASFEKSVINLERNKGFKNLKIYSGLFEALEKELDSHYDYIIVSNITSQVDNRNEFIALCTKLNRHLTTNGRLVIAVDNRLGLKFFAGTKPEQGTNYFDGITGYRFENRELSYSKEAITQIMADSGIAEYNFYYPYPDYMLMHTLYSDDRLPKTGELTDNLKNYAGDRMSLFDEKGAFDSFIKDGNFDRFSNSYIIVTGKKPETVYAKFSTERDKTTALVTSIEQMGDGTRIVKKHALFNEGRQHIENMAKNYISLCEKYSDCDLKVNRCIGLSEDKSTAAFEYVEGITLSEALDRCISSNSMEEFNSKLDRYMAYIGEKSNVPPYNRDVIFDNILVSPDEWTLIDYEWCNDEPVDGREIAFRSFHTYLVSDKKRNIFNHDLLFEKLGINPTEGRLINEKEFKFQEAVKGSSLSLADLNHKLGHEILEPIGNNSEKGYRFQVYRLDESGNFSEGNSFFAENAYGLNNSASISLELSASDKLIRLDPLMHSCMVKINDIAVDDVTVPINRRTVISNGKFVKPDTFLFDSNDPNIVVSLSKVIKGNVKGRFTASFTIYPMPEDFIANLSSHIGRF